MRLVVRCSNRTLVERGIYIGSAVQVKKVLMFAAIVIVITEQVYFFTPVVLGTAGIVFGISADVPACIDRTIGTHRFITFKTDVDNAGITGRFVLGRRV